MNDPMHFLQRKSPLKESQNLLIDEIKENRPRSRLEIERDRAWFCGK